MDLFSVFKEPGPREQVDLLKKHAENQKKNAPIGEKIDVKPEADGLRIKRLISTVDANGDPATIECSLCVKVTAREIIIERAPVAGGCSCDARVSAIRYNSLRLAIGRINSFLE